MAKKFNIEIVTPEKLVFKGEVKSLVVPSYKGYLGVLADHAPLVCMLVPGEITVHSDDKTDVYSISGGFMEVAKNNAVVLADSAEKPGEIDVQRAASAKERAQSRLKKPGRDIDQDRAREAHLRAKNRKRIAGKYK